MRNVLVIISIVFSVWAGDASADFKDGNDLHADCTSNNGVETGLCLGYVMAITDAMDELRPNVCIPRTVNGTQVVDIVKKHLTDYPAGRHFDAWSIVAFALEKVFPCN
jgi:hypothetical protein